MKTSTVEVRGVQSRVMTASRRHAYLQRLSQPKRSDDDAKRLHSLFGLEFGQLTDSLQLMPMAGTRTYRVNFENDGQKKVASAINDSASNMFMTPPQILKSDIRMAERKRAPALPEGYVTGARTKEWQEWHLPGTVDVGVR